MKNIYKLLRLNDSNFIYRIHNQYCFFNYELVAVCVCVKVIYIEKQTLFECVDIYSMDQWGACFVVNVIII